MKTSIIYEDKDTLVAYKPIGLATQTARPGQADMVSELKNYLAAKGKTGTRAPYLGIIHRLDQPVEGLLVFAKNKNAAASLTKQLSDGRLNKQYLAVACGKPSSKEGTLADYLYKDKNNRAQITKEGEEGFPQAKKAVLHYRVLETIALPECLTLMEIHIDTGRFHQIRAQMSNGGMALLGDVKYGGEAEPLSRRLGIGTVALCAFKISFVHPATGRILKFSKAPAGKGFSLFYSGNFQ